MAAAKYNILIEQGASFNRTITIRDGAGVALDLSGWTFRGQIRASQSAQEPIASFTCALLNQTTDTGKMTFSLPAVTSAGIAVPNSNAAERKLATYLYDLEAVRPDGTVLRLLEGTATVSPEMTK